MSTDTTIENKNGTEGTNSSEGQAGGSPPENKNGTEGNATEGEGQETPDYEAQAKELRRKVTEMSEESANDRELRQFIANNPDLRDAVLRKINGGGQAQDPFVVMDKTIDEDFDEKTAPRLKKLMRMAASIGEQRAEARVRPLVGEVTRSAAETQFIKGLRSAGLDADIVDDPEFDQLRRELRGSHRSFSALEAEDASFAADIIASKWKAKKGKQNDYTRERRRIEDAKDSSLNSRGSRPSQVSDSERHDIPYASGMRGILKAIKAGVPENKIHLTTNKK